MQAPHMRYQFDPRHLRHVEIGDEDVGYCDAQLHYRSDTIVGCGDVVPGGPQQYL